jgi:hypothetical protein
MPATFDAAFRRVKQLVANFRANEKFPSSIRWEKVAAGRMRGNSNIVFGLDCQIDALVYAFTPSPPTKSKSWKAQPNEPSHQTGWIIIPVVWKI